MTTARRRPKPSFAEQVIAWQHEHGRHGLPWQGTGDPYRVWLSEIMLQQTQVSTVIGYYDRFLQRFPNVRALAAAPLDDVLALWAGLGYYSRARMLHRCAIDVVQQHGGQFPPSAQALAELPGIGPSTAAAIAAFCFGERAAILDGNVKRVLARWLAFDGDLSEAAQHRMLLGHAHALLPDQEEGIAAYTQGLMDIGSGVCTQRQPRCDACPVAAGCAARGQGDPLRYPVKSRRLKRGRRENVLLMLTCADRIWLVQRPVSGVWGGLWSLPEFADDAALAAAVPALPGQLQRLASVQHALTHFDWTLHVQRLTIETAAPQAMPGRWVGAPDLHRHGLPAPVRSIVESAWPAWIRTTESLAL
jgi:A/G-specific adenine glycosylase